MSHVSVLLAGGGTGGHIFPALAVAERLTALQPGVSCRFLCSNRPLDAEILSKESLRGAPVSFRALSAAPFGLRPRTLLRFVSHWGESVRHAREEIRALRSAGKSVVIAAFGGFVAAPVVQAARVEKAPVVMANLDAVPGKANRWIARHAGDILTTTPIDRFPWPVCGPIVRSAALAPADPAECRRRLGLTDSLPTLVICGGSQGAGSLNRMLLDMLRDDPGVLQGWQVVHQTGKADAEACRAAYASANIPSLVEPFFREVGLLWGAAELAVCRAGAGNVAEVWANRVPAVFVPYPHHKDNHQRANALPLERAGAARIAEESGPVSGGVPAPIAALRSLLAQPTERERMREKLRGMGPADGAGKMAELLLARGRRSP